MGKRLWKVGSTATNREIVSGFGKLWGMRVRTTEGTDGVRRWVAEGDGCGACVVDTAMHGPDLEWLPDRRLVLLPAGRLDGNATVPAGAAVLTKPIKPSQLYAALKASFGGDFEVGSRPEATSTSPPSFSSLRILLADDSIINQRVGTAILESLGYRTVTASNGLEVLARLRQEAFDVVLMDIQMPEMDGLEATDPAIVILDEATSEIDVRSEWLIHAALAEFLRGRTAFLITHRLSTLELADRIVVMERGGIVEVGTHDELQSRCEKYQRLRPPQGKARRLANHPAHVAIATVLLPGGGSRPAGKHLLL